MACSTAASATLSFNPRAREGRDIIDPRHALGLNQFQSTRPRGARLRGRSTPSHHRSVSIHAPARGATGRDPVPRPFDARFQSTRPRGARQPVTEAGLCNAMFQSTRPRGARQQLNDCHAHKQGVSIHAPARGATRDSRTKSGRRWCFNPRAREGRGAAQSLPHLQARRFNPRAREGRDGCSV